MAMVIHKSYNTAICGLHLSFHRDTQKIWLWLVAPQSFLLRCWLQASIDNTRRYCWVIDHFHFPLPHPQIYCSHLKCLLCCYEDSPLQKSHQHPEAKTGNENSFWKSSYTAPKGGRKFPPPWNSAIPLPVPPALVCMKTDSLDLEPITHGSTGC